MTIDELVEEAAKLKGWALGGGVHIRNRSGKYCCPVTAVALAQGRYFFVYDWEDAAEYIGLSRKDGRMIVANADSEPARGGDLRLKMLKAFNLEGK